MGLVLTFTCDQCGKVVDMVGDTHNYHHYRLFKDNRQVGEKYLCLRCSKNHEIMIYIVPAEDK